MLNPSVWQTVQERQRAMTRLLARVAPQDGSQLTLLEVGCGSGGKLAGIELLEARHAKARHALPAALRLTLGDATEAAVAPASVDIVLQPTVFSSLLDDAFQQQQRANAMWRWVKPGGGVLWYDFTVNNPRNPDVRGVPLARMRAPFPQGHVQSQRVTLAPPIARAVTRVHPGLYPGRYPGLYPGLYPVFNAVPLLRTHALAWLAKAE